MNERLIRALEGNGYKCFVPLEKKSCFDIAAKSGERVPVTFKVPVPNSVGACRLEAKLVTAGGDTVTSVRDFSGIAPE